MHILYRKLTTYDLALIKVTWNVPLLVGVAWKNCAAFLCFSIMKMMRFPILCGHFSTSYLFATNRHISQNRIISSNHNRLVSCRKNCWIEAFTQVVEKHVALDLHPEMRFLHSLGSFLSYQPIVSFLILLFKFCPPSSKLCRLCCRYKIPHNQFQKQTRVNF